MANESVIADVQFALKLNEKFVGDRMTAPDTSLLMALFKKAKTVMVEGRGLVAYFGSKTRGHSGSGYVAENGDLPSPGRAVTQQNSVTAQFGAMAVGFSDHQIRGMEGGTAHQNREKIGLVLQDEVSRQRERILADLMTRDDSVKGRAAQAVSSSKTVYSSIPIRFVVGDRVSGFPAPGTNDERLLTGTEVTTEAYVENIETDSVDELTAATGGKITLSAAVSYDDDAVLTLAGAKLTTSILGIESHFDTVNDSSFQWDADDAATVDHGQEDGGEPQYAGLQRSSFANLNCGTINANGASLALNHLTRAAQKSIQQGGQRIQGKLMAMMHPLQYDRFLVTQEGKTPDSNDVQINGQNFSLPYIATGTARRLNIITTPMFKDGVVAVFPSDFLWKAFHPVGWDPTMVRQGAASGVGYSAAFIQYWTYFLNTFCDMPFYTTLIYGLDKSNT